MARTSLADEVRLALRERVLRGELVPGERIVEQLVAQEMGTSQGPVREAFASLCQEGLLITLPHRGTFVSEVSEAEARMAYAIRERIEPMAVGLAMESVDEQFISTLESLLGVMREAARASDVPGFIAADMNFHTAFYELAGSDVLNGVWRPVAGTIRKFIAVAALQYYGTLAESAADHVLLIDLVRAEKRTELADATAAHLNNIWRRIGTAASTSSTTGRTA